MKVEELLKGMDSPKYFILDSHQDAMNEQELGHRHDDSDYNGYGYNIHNFNQLVPGSFFLYRRPRKLSADKKFHIYGGGVIDSISCPDVNGNVIAKVKLGFELTKSIDQGDPFIENYNWLTRSKPGPGWKGFWTNYGMNEIKKEDFWNIVQGRSCILCGNEVSGIQTIEENEEVIDSSIFQGYAINIDDNGTTIVPHSHSMKKYIAKKIDFSALNKRRKTMGTAGELIVLQYENDKLQKAGVPLRAEHVADTIGDGLGYDIKSYELDGTEIHIEVKTTKSPMCDNFFMSRREIEESQNSLFKYKIYRVYNYNETKRTADIKIYDGAITDNDFDLEPVSYKVRIK